MLRDAQAIRSARAHTHPHPGPHAGPPAAGLVIHGGGRHAARLHRALQQRAHALRLADVHILEVRHAGGGAAGAAAARRLVVLHHVLLAGGGALAQQVSDLLVVDLQHGGLQRRVGAVWGQCVGEGRQAQATGVHMTTGAADLAPPSSQSKSGLGLCHGPQSPHAAPRALACLHLIPPALRRQLLGGRKHLQPG